MSDSAKPTQAWIAPLVAVLAGREARGPLFVALPDYRPNLVRAMADALDLSFLDFRAQKMRPLGWEAGQLPLSALTEAVTAQVATGRGLVLHNAEALLAAKPVEERRAWLRGVATQAWAVPVLIAIAIFQADLPKLSASRLHRVDPDHVPPETLLSRLARQ